MAKTMMVALSVPDETTPDMVKQFLRDAKADFLNIRKLGRAYLQGEVEEYVNARYPEATARFQEDKRAEVLRRAVLAMSLSVEDAWEIWLDKELEDRGV